MTGYEAEPRVADTGTQYQEFDSQFVQSGNVPGQSTSYHVEDSGIAQDPPLWMQDLSGTRDQTNDPSGIFDVMYSGPDDDGAHAARSDITGKPESGRYSWVHYVPKPGKT